MSLRSRLSTWWRAIVHGRDIVAQIDEELRFHIESHAEDLMRGGISREEALRRAKSELGAAAAVRENTRQAWGTRALDELWSDLRYGWRMLRKNPGLAAMGVASLALGIGANTAIFSLTNALLLNAMPVSHPEQLRLLEWQAQHQLGYKNLPMGSLYGSVNFSKTGVATGTEFSYDEYSALRRSHAIFQGLAAYYHAGGAALQAGNDLQHGTIEYVSPNFFQVLGVRAAMGRTILPSDNAPEALPSWCSATRFGATCSADRSPRSVRRSM